MMALATYTPAQLRLIIPGTFMIFLAGGLIFTHLHYRFGQQVNRAYLAINLLVIGLGTYMLCLPMLKPHQSPAMPAFMAIGMLGIAWCLAWYGRVFESVSIVDSVPKKKLIGPSLVWALAALAMATPFSILS